MGSSIWWKSESSSVADSTDSTFDAQTFADSRPPSLWPDFLSGQPDRPVRVLLVDDDPHIRLVIANELLADRRIDLIAQAGTVRESRRLIAIHDFDVMMVDLNLGDGSGYDLIEQMKAGRPFAEAVVISGMEDEEHALRAFELGATGYLVKNSWFGDFPQAVLQVVNGGASITPVLARRLLRKLCVRPYETNPAAQTGTQTENLTARERDVLKMVAAGYTSVEISDRLTITSQTVNTHIKHIYSKLHVRNRAQAVRFAAQFRLV